MRENVGEMRTRITPNTDYFYAVKTLYFFICEFDMSTDHWQQMNNFTATTVLPLKIKQFYSF